MVRSNSKPVRPCYVQRIMTTVVVGSNSNSPLVRSSLT